MGAVLVDGISILLLALFGNGLTIRLTGISQFSQVDLFESTVVVLLQQYQYNNGS